MSGTHYTDRRLPPPIAYFAPHGESTIQSALTSITRSANVSGAGVTPTDGTVTAASSSGSLRSTKLTTGSYVSCSFASTDGTNGGEETTGETGIGYDAVG